MNTGTAELRLKDVSATTTLSILWSGIIIIKICVQIYQNLSEMKPSYPVVITQSTIIWLIRYVTIIFLSIVQIYDHDEQVVELKILKL